MSPKLIQVGKTYCNRGAGRTTRKVEEIGTQIKAPWFSSSMPPNEPVVQYRQDGKIATLYLRSFAQWAGSEVTL